MPNAWIGGVASYLYFAIYLLPPSSQGGFLFLHLLLCVLLLLFCFHCRYYVVQILVSKKLASVCGWLFHLLIRYASVWLLLLDLKLKLYFHIKTGIFCYISGAGVSWYRSFQLVIKSLVGKFFFIPHLCNTKYLLYLGYHLLISTLSFHANIFHNRTGYSFSLVFGHHLLSNESETKAGEQLMGHDLETVQFSS